MQFQVLLNPWGFATVSALLIGLATFVLSHFNNEKNPPGKAATAFATGLCSLLLLTWVVNGGGDGAVLQDPFPTG